MTLREKLDLIDEMLCEEGGQELADVLTALRGPDSGDDLLKWTTTAVIREEAFPRFCEKAGGLWVANTTKGMFGIRKPRMPASLHFLDHAKLAGRALGLLWKEVE